MISFFIFSCSTNLIESSSVEKINKYDEAANFLMMVADEQSELKNTCTISSKEAFNLIGQLHALIDEEIKTRKYNITNKLEASCEANCHCGIYSDITNIEITKENLYQKAKNTPKSALITCAIKTSKWICSSELLKLLKSEVTTINSDSSFEL